MKGKMFLQMFLFVQEVFCSGSIHEWKIVGKSDPFRVTGVMHVTLSLSFNFFLSIFSEVHAVESSGLFIR